MNNTVRKKSLRGVAVAMGIHAEEGIGWSIKGTAKRSLMPSGHKVIRT